MHVQITGRNIDITDGMREHVDLGIEKMKFTDHILEGHVTLTVEKHRQICELHFVGKNFDEKVMEESKDLYASMDAAFKTMELQLKKQHDRFKKRRTQDHRAKQQEENDQFTITD